MVNRFLWEKLGGGDYSFVIANAGLIKSLLPSMYNFNLLQRILYPVAVSRLRKEHPQFV